MDIIKELEKVKEITDRKKEESVDQESGRSNWHSQNNSIWSAVNSKRKEEVEVEVIP